MTTKTFTAAALLVCSTLSTTTLAQKTLPGDASASMVKPPSAAGASTTRPDNPDNMPVKRPTPTPASDRMLHNSPASDAIAK